MNGPRALSAETLRRAARRMRVEHAGEESDLDQFFRAVAGLLDGLASDEPWDFRHDEALIVARAYPGDAMGVAMRRATGIEAV